VLTDIGHFGAFFKLSKYRDPVLVSSSDGVGHKLKIAVLMDKHDTIGMDLVNHCVTIYLLRRRPPLMLDYVGMVKLHPHKAAANSIRTCAGLQGSRLRLDRRRDGRDARHV
jgi:phosphoribosylformylglycinamidine cyclo-ligase